MGKLVLLRKNPIVERQGSSLLLTKEKAPLELDGGKVDGVTRAPVDDVDETCEDRSLF